jgi:hypothetical protein
MTSFYLSTKKSCPIGSALIRLTQKWIGLKAGFGSNIIRYFSK